MRKKEEELSEKILNYFRENPDAGDTIDGIVHWWLGQEKSQRTVEHVAKALDLLLNRGMIKLIKTQAGPAIYKLRENAQHSIHHS